MPSNRTEFPTWAESVAQRLAFFAQRGVGLRSTSDELTTTLAALRRHRAAEPQANDRLLQGFLRACLVLFEETVDSRTDLAEIRADLNELCVLARTALNTDCDDRPLLARENALQSRLGGMDSATLSATLVPGRVVWLAAMAAKVPEEEGAAAAMLVNDLAAVDPDLPLQALEAAMRAERPS